MFTGEEIVRILAEMKVSHAVWVPDSEFGLWESTLEASPIRLIRVCREGEAWPLAAGLFLGGAAPLVIMQTTGLFESGDALRNVLFDLQLPIYALLGARSWLTPHSRDSARKFAEPILRAWGFDSCLCTSSSDARPLASHYFACREAKRPGAALLAEGSP